MAYSQSQIKKGKVERSRTLPFSYNGHSFDAYEVLGLSPGSSVQAAEQAYQKACAGSDAKSLELLKVALEAFKKAVPKK